MKLRLVSSLFYVTILSCQVLAEGENEIKKGTYPFMAYVYYENKNVTEFMRGAILLKPSWLITSSMNELSEGFPLKTLLARTGTVTIDSDAPFNEDEDEQEREIIRIVSPQNRSDAQWWRTDISLLKTLTPFNPTAFVNIATLLTDSHINDSNCFFLVFARKSSNSTDDMVLMQLYVDLMPTSSKECGIYYHETMLCAQDNREINKNIARDDEFCQGNRGGPLVCGKEVAGIQTYVGDTCNPPYLYLKLSVWSNFITCGIEDKCNEEQCENMCKVFNKDTTVNATEKTSSKITAPIKSTTGTTNLTTTLIDKIIYDEDYISPSSPTPTITTEQTFKDETLGTTTTSRTTISTTISTPISTPVRTETTSWPKEKHPQTEKAIEEENKVERKVNVAAQRQNLKARKTKGKANRNVNNIISLIPILVYCHI